MKAENMHERGSKCDRSQHAIEAVPVDSSEECCDLSDALLT